jgi:formylglycine-generating enzyme required for sulfatase activity
MTNGQAGCCGSADRDASTVAAPADQFEFTPSVSPIRRRWTHPLGGSFQMGSSQPARFPDDGEGPARQVTLSHFAIACHTVSNTQFGDFVRETHYTTDAERYGWSFVFEGLIPPERRDAGLRRSAETPWWLAVPHAYWAQPEGPASTVLDRLDHPVVHVSWNDARAYCHWSGTRLPTEAEWELAARGDLEQARFPWGNEVLVNGEHRCNIWQGQFPVLNTIEDGYLGTAPVHSYKPNGHGLHNVVGNVWEWCADHFSPSYHSETPARDPLGSTPGTRRALRGGSFLCHESYCDRYRVAARSSNIFDSSSSNIGFRVAQSRASASRTPT